MFVVNKYLLSPNCVSDAVLSTGKDTTLKNYGSEQPFYFYHHCNSLSKLLNDKLLSWFSCLPWLYFLPLNHFQISIAKMPAI